MRTISPELIGSIFSGLVLVIGAAATFTANRSRQSGEERKTLRRRVRLLERKVLAAVQHIFTLESDLAQRGLPVPSRPAVLEADDDDDPPATPTPRNASDASSG